MLSRTFHQINMSLQLPPPYSLHDPQKEEIKSSSMTPTPKKVYLVQAYEDKVVLFTKIYSSKQDAHLAELAHLNTIRPVFIKSITEKIKMYPNHHLPLTIYIQYDFCAADRIPMEDFVNRKKDQDFCGRRTHYTVWFVGQPLLPHSYYHEHVIRLCYLLSAIQNDKELDENHLATIDTENELNGKYVKVWEHDLN